MENNLLQIGQRIRDERNKQKWLISELSERTGLSVAHISSIERGKCNFSVEGLVNLSSALGTDVRYILFGEYSPTVEIQENLQKVIDDCNQYEINILIENAHDLKRILRKNSI